MIYHTYTYIKELRRQVSLCDEEVSCTSYTSLAQVAILLLQDFSTLCVTDIYGIYFRLSVQCLQYNKCIIPWIYLIRPNDGRSISVSFETVSLNILVHDVINSLCGIYKYIHIYTYGIYIFRRSNPSKNQTQSKMDGKICQNIKLP